MKKILVLAVFSLYFGLTNLYGQKLGYVKRSNFPTELYLAGHLKKDYNKSDNGNLEPDDDKAYFVSQVNFKQKAKYVTDVAFMNIDGKQITLRSKPRKARGDHDYASSKTWFSGKDGYKVYMTLYYVGKKDPDNERMKLTVYYKKGNKSMVLIPARMGD